MSKDADAFYQAVLARDHRFDGKFFVAVKTTGIYCRPICPAKPKRENVEFFSSALAAEKAGYRPCLRCRPECAPHSPAWSGTSALVTRALRLISDGRYWDAGDEEFAAIFGVSVRHLRRLFEDELGKTPRQIAAARRLDFARKLIVETDLAMTEIAFSAGFASLRNFNTEIRARFRRSPSELRKSARAKPVPRTGIELSLPYRPPFDWGSLLRFHQAHRIEGLESVGEENYERIFEIAGSVGIVKISHREELSELRAEILLDEHRHLFRVVQNLRQIFDLDSDPLLVANGFSECSILGGLWSKYPGMRVAKGWDPFETLICSILGQLVSTERARQLVARLLEAYGKTAKHPLNGEPIRFFPRAEVLADCSLERVGTTGVRKATIREVSKQVLAGTLSLDPVQDPAEFRKALLKIKGIGPWTAEYASLRAFGDPDAFPGTDLVLKRMIESKRNLNLEGVRPWRGYAAVYLWREFMESASKSGGKV